MRRLWIIGLLFLVVIGGISWRYPQQAMAQDEPDVKFQLERIRVEDLTNPETDDDDPYFVMIGFRSRVFTPGSTEVFLCGDPSVVVCGKPYDFTNLGGNEEADIPTSMGLLPFDNVHLSTVDSIAEGDFPELIGVVVIAFENDASIDDVLKKIKQDQLPRIENEIRTKIEAGGLGLDFNSNNGDSTGGGNEGGNGLNIPKPSLDIDLPGPDIITDLFADDPVDVHLFAYAAVDNEIAELLRDINTDSWITFGPLSNANYVIGTNPIIFKGDGGEWHVTASMVTSAQSTAAPEVTCASTKHPLLTHRSYFPLIAQEGTDNRPNPGDLDTSPPVQLKTLQYNVQFLTPWNEGEILKDHWPNTSGRAVAVGEALACYDILALNETVSDTRRGEIISTMNSRAPNCGRPNLLPGDSFFASVSGPHVEDAHITGWKPAIDALKDRPGGPLVGDELTIVSRFPIVETNSHIYEHSYGIDALAAKGVLHARLHNNQSDSKEYIDVFTTHLQAGYSEIKRCQILELADFIAEHADSDNPIILLGDFNIDGLLVQQQDLNSVYNYLMNILGSLASGHVLKDTGRHLGATNNEGTERIDYIFVSQLGLITREEDVHVLQFDGYDFEGKNTLSDHAAVEANMTWIPKNGIPDLIVDNLISTNNGVQVTIKNIGSAPVTDEFWVDVYINPSPAPTIVNQTWQFLAKEGLVWGVTKEALPLDPGETLILNFNDAYYRAAYSNFSGSLPEGTPVYAQVDSANTSTNYGAVQEIHEFNGGAYNNINGPVLSTQATEPMVAPLNSGEGQPTSAENLPPRP